ncbi:alpha/beta fold hydrolase [Herbiconiux sp. UC225_62]|uniref:alpha/beta fold hydrolase n=1 Tax=Herbiconiux sp. UC225_62 TaxID=3350168 RepID=UPI0036D23FAC
MTVVPAYSEHGDGPPLVLLMGLGAPASAWLPHSEHWARSHRCLLLENRGSGGTPLGAVPASTQDYADDVASLLESLGTGPVAVAGISMGACVAQEVALRHPQLVSRLLLVAPWARVDPATASTLSVLARARAGGDDRLLNEMLRNLVWTPEWVNRHAAEMAPGLDLPPTLSPQAFSAQADACATHDSLSRLAQIACPTLVTLGEQDAFIRPELSVEVADAIPGAELRRFASGHVHHWEELDEFNRTTEEWLA